MARLPGLGTSNVNAFLAAPILSRFFFHPKPQRNPSPSSILRHSETRTKISKTPSQLT
ncbi:Protein of unknown function [Pyronema omphalodes CBS 100304]|uniref:Uncharacterized protein n=1 Tax=Pyronema omphalodes (strain CBS 100304) TaxID=1076935 RepID=U4LWC7_PYROM|nr:Protein of unknown function [Pyronema omphalodes CBS 100304]